MFLLAVLVISMASPFTSHSTPIFFHLGTETDISADSSMLRIDFWYGSHQTFGQIGMTQRWVNILGNISARDSIEDCYYVLNDQPAKNFNLGPDLHRLANQGDFNIDLPISEVKEGNNVLAIFATSGDQYVSDTITFEIFSDRNWPIPYEVDFTTISNLQEVVQVVDGLWSLSTEGAHTVEPYYDRVLSIGDTSWRNYEALLKLTIHDWTPSQPGPPTYNVSHFGMAMHWRGHHHDGRQPARKWYPLGAQGEFLLKENMDSCQWRILFDGKYREKPPRYAPKYNKITKGRTMWVKTQVEVVDVGSCRYRFKQWLHGDTEPSEWDVEGIESNDYESGALCIVPHNSEVTIHQLKVNKIP